MEVSNIYITTFIQSIEVHRVKLEEAFLDNSGVKELTAMLELSLDAVKNIGHTAYEELQVSLEDDQNSDTEKIKNDLSNYFVCFDWVEAAKSFKLLLRDVLIQHNKSEHLFRLGQVQEVEWKLQRQKSMSVIDEAIVFLRDYYSNGVRSLLNDEKKFASHLLEYSLQNNPWPVYHGQFKLIDKQVRDIVQGNKELIRVSGIFHNIRKQILETAKICEKEFNQFLEKAKQASTYVDNNIDEKPGAVASFLEDLESEIKLPDHLNTFNSELQDNLEGVHGDIKIPVGSRGGVILQNEIDFKVKIKDWLETEILPLLYEVWEYTENLEGNLKMALVNIQNRAGILAKGDKESKAIQGENKKATQPIDSYLHRSKDWIQKIDALSKQIDERMQAHFNFKDIFSDPEDFLPVSMQSTIGNLQLGQNEIVQYFNNLFRRASNFIQRIRRDVEKEEKLSLSEKVVRAIEAKETNIAYGQYASIFLTKGYIGESFWVGRKEHLTHLEETLETWKAGFRGGILITGRRLAGKSLFGEKVANQHFLKNTIRLAPNSLVRVNGRKFSSTEDLIPTLEFIRQHNDGTPSLVWIDDLELWCSEQVLLGKNVRELIDFIDTAPKHLFFMVAMSSWLKVHLDNLYKLSAAFQAEINLDKMDQAEIAKAILIRHGATHKVLVDRDGIEISAPAYQKRVARIHKQAKANIGDALNLWIANVEDGEEEKIGLKPMQSFSLPDFISPDSAVILSTILLQKTTSDYRLRRIFGSPFGKSYRKNLQRMIKLKIVIRNLDGTLTINENIANELVQILERKKYLKTK